MANPWDATFDRVRVVYTPGCVYDRSLREIPALLDEAERELGTHFPESYRAFMLRFGPGELQFGPGELYDRIKLVQLARTDNWWDSLLAYTQHVRGYDLAGDLANAAWLGQVVYVGADGAGACYAWHPLEVTSPHPHECRFYRLERMQEEQPEAVGDSFADVLRWGAAEVGARHEKPAPDEFLFHPKPLRWREKPKHSDVHRWLFFNNRTARLIARSIRDEGRADAFQILADALQDAGCAHADLLDACRAGDPDVDGRWVLQVLFGEA